MIPGYQSAARVRIRTADAAISRTHSHPSPRFIYEATIGGNVLPATLSSKIVLYKHELGGPRVPIAARSPLSRYNVAETRLTGLEGGEVGGAGVEPPCSGIFMRAECARFEPIYRLCSARMYAVTYACVYTRARAYICVCVCLSLCVRARTYRYVGIR